MRAIEHLPRSAAGTAASLTWFEAELAVASFHAAGIWAVAVLTRDGRARVAARDPRTGTVFTAPDRPGLDTLTVRVLHL